VQSIKNEQPLNKYIQNKHEREQKNKKIQTSAAYSWNINNFSIQHLQTKNRTRFQIIFSCYTDMLPSSFSQLVGGVGCGWL
jgi:hypothetical protein